MGTVRGQLGLVWLLLAIVLIGIERQAACKGVGIRQWIHLGEAPVSVWWMAPFLSGGGYSSEAIAFVTSLASVPSMEVRVSQHGDTQQPNVLEGLEPRTRAQLGRLSAEHKPPLSPAEARRTVVVCHSEPNAWLPPLYHLAAPCPRDSYAIWHRVVARTMYETDRLDPEHVKRCNQMDEVWVPTEFNMRTFAGSGVAPHKLRRVPEPVDTRFFNPGTTRPLQALETSCVCGCHHQGQVTTRFLSVFKWEERKGWEVLVAAFAAAFEGAGGEGAALYIKSERFYDKGASSFEQRVLEAIRRYASEATMPHFARHGARALPRIHLIHQHIAHADLPSLYRSMDAFVLPSRGEGWGRPHVEAMAMGLPVIATNWSGPTEYMTQHNAYPLRIDGLVTVQDGSFKGHQWAQPSVEHLRQLLWEVHEKPQEARRRGVQARRDMLARYSPEVVGRLVAAELRRVRSMPRSQQCADDHAVDRFLFGLCCVAAACMFRLVKLHLALSRGKPAKMLL